MDDILRFIPVLGALVSLAFAGLLFKQYLDKKGPHQIAWAFAMLLFAMGFIGESLGLIFGWTQFSAKIYYLFGGILSVGYLSLGTIYLLKPDAAKWISVSSLTLIFILWIPIYGLKLFKANDYTTAAIIILLYLVTILGAFFISTSKSILAALVTVTVLSSLSLNQHFINLNILAKTESWRDVMNIPLRSSAFTFSAVGSLILIIGAVYSVKTGWKNEKSRPYAYSTLIIALGVLIAASGGTLHGIFDIGKQVLLSISTTFGIAVMLAGFLQPQLKKK